MITDEKHKKLEAFRKENKLMGKWENDYPILLRNGKHVSDIAMSDGKMHAIKLLIEDANAQAERIAELEELIRQTETVSLSKLIAERDEAKLEIARHDERIIELESFIRRAYFDNIDEHCEAQQLVPLM